MAINPAQARDTRIDVFRALALLTIFLNHVPGTVFEHLTHKNFGFSDSAEAFVLISGIAIGLAYGPKFQPGNRIVMTLKAWRRAGVLYVTHIMTTVATLAIFSGAAIFYGRPDILQLINIDIIIRDTPKALVGLATLGHQIGYNNILSMYAAVLLMLPLFLMIGARSIALMVTASGALWLAAGLWQIAPPNYPTEGFWFLNPLSWQFLFVIGMAGMLHVRRGGEIRFNRIVAGAAFAYLVMSLLWIKLEFWGYETATGLPAVIGGFDKTFLSLPRLLHVLALAYLIVTIPSIGNLARTSAGNPLAILGRHSLPVFVAGTILAMLAQVLKTVTPGGIGFDASLIAVGIALQFALAYYLEWLPTFGWGALKAKPQPAPHAAVSPAIAAMANAGAAAPALAR